MSEDITGARRLILEDLFSSHLGEQAFAGMLEAAESARREGGRGVLVLCGDEVAPDAIIRVELDLDRLSEAYVPWLIHVTYAGQRFRFSVDELRQWMTTLMP